MTRASARVSVVGVHFIPNRASARMARTIILIAPERLRLLFCQRVDISETDAAIVPAQLHKESCSPRQRNFSKTYQLFLVSRIPRSLRAKPAVMLCVVSHLCPGGHSLYLVVVFSLFLEFIGSASFNEGPRALPSRLRPRLALFAGRTGCTAAVPAAQGLRVIAIQQQSHRRCHLCTAFCVRSYDTRGGNLV